MIDGIYYNFKEVAKELNKISVPKKTESYTPVRHSQLMSFCKDKGGMHLNKEPHSYRIKTDVSGNKLAFTINWASEVKEFGVSISGVNSYDKSCSMKIAIGASTWACLNTQVFGDIMIARLHTGEAVTIIQEYVTDMFGSYERKFTEFLDMVEKLKAVKISDRQAAKLVGELRYYGIDGKTGIINDRESNTAIKHWNKNNLYKAHTAWDLYSALTDALKMASTRYTLNKHADLHIFFQDNYETDDSVLVRYDNEENEYISEETNELMFKCTTLNELKKYTSEKGGHCFIKKEGTLTARHIVYNSNLSWDIYNSFKDSYISYSTDEEFLDKETSIFNSMKEGSLYLDSAK